VKFIDVMFASAFIKQLWFMVRWMLFCGEGLVLIDGGDGEINGLDAKVCQQTSREHTGGSDTDHH